MDAMASKHRAAWDAAREAAEKIAARAQILTRQLDEEYAKFDPELGPDVASSGSAAAR